MPGFREYLDTILKRKQSYFKLTSETLDMYKKNPFFSKHEIEMLGLESQKINPRLNLSSPIEILLTILSSRKWYENPVIEKYLEKPMINLARYFVLNEKRKDRETDVILYNCYDPVANFHLSNGAAVGSLNFLANITERGINESYSMMANYIYDIDKLDKNKMRYTLGEIDCRI